MNNLLSQSSTAKELNWVLLPVSTGKALSPSLARWGDAFLAFINDVAQIWSFSDPPLLHSFALKPVYLGHKKTPSLRDAIYEWSLKRRAPKNKGIWIANIFVWGRHGSTLVCNLSQDLKVPSSNFDRLFIELEMMRDILYQICCVFISLEDYNRRRDIILTKLIISMEATLDNFANGKRACLVFWCLLYF